MRINFILPPCELSGGPLAILEYANRFIERGHDVTVTTYPKKYWPKSWNEEPFPWFKFNGKVIYGEEKDSALFTKLIKRISKALGNKEQKPLAAFENIINEASIVSQVISYMPDCDINIATFWSTAFAAYFSKKGKPVYFMQHYEEVFYTNDYYNILMKLAVRMSYELPLYKVANSSWLQRQIQVKYGQKVPFSNNAVELLDFSPRPKKSEKDGIIRIVTFSRPEEWKGFADVVVAMSKIKREYGNRVQWHVFGREHAYIPPDNGTAPYTLHKGLPFAELSKLYAECDIAVCASWYESFPLPPIEAMASGTAVVTTHEGMEDYCFDGVNCLLVKARDIESIYNGIKKLIENPELRKRLANEGLKTSKEFSWNKAVIEREKILIDILDGAVEYDVFQPLHLGLVDGNSIPFEKMPLDLMDKFYDGQLISYNGAIFIISNGCKRHISTAELFAQIIEPGTPITEVNGLDFSRIPFGLPILTKYDI